MTTHSDKAGHGATRAKFLSRADVAETMTCSLRTVDRLIERGDLTAVRHGARTLIPADALDAYIATLPPVGAA